MKVYGLIGRSLKHSFSKTYFEEKFTGLNVGHAEYRNFEFTQVDGIREELSKIDILKGLNVTIPYKISILPQLDELDEIAKATGAVNTIRIGAGGKWTGYNTDVYGFATSLKPFLGKQNTRALVLGTGGASRAVVYALRKLNLRVFLVSRTPGKGDLTYDELNSAVIGACKLIVNTTPLGMWPDVDAAPHIPYGCLTSGHLVYDLVYNPEKSLFLQNSESEGAMILNGLNMLKFQAEKAWEIWNAAGFP